jgi:outer membrane protein assembly factor BamB
MGHDFCNFCAGQIAGAPQSEIRSAPFVKDGSSLPKAPRDTGHDGNDENNPDDHVKLSIPAVAAQGNSVLTYHGDNSRSGNFVVPALSWEKARSVHLDPNFDARVAGHLYAQPLYWHPSDSNSGMLLVATEDNVVLAFDATTGKEVWEALGRASCQTRVIAMREHQSAWNHRHASDRSSNPSNLFGRSR